MRDQEAFHALRVTQHAVERARGGALASSGFRWFFAAIVFHSLGFWVGDVGQRWLVQELTASPFYVGLIGFCGNLPMVLFSLPGGVLADRVERVRLIAVSRSFGGILTLVLAVLAVSGLAQVWHVALYALILGSMFSIEVPSRQALFPTLVPREHLMHAVAISSAVWSGSTVVGPAVAGVLITGIGIPGCFFVAAALQVLAVVSFLQAGRYTPRRPDGEQHDHPWAAFCGGLAYIRTHAVIFGLLVLALLTVVFGQSPSMALLPSFSAGVLGGDASTFGLLLTATGAGGLAANIGLSLRANAPGKGRLAVVMGAGLGLALLALSRAEVLPWALLILVVVGILSSGIMTLISTLIQAQVREGMRGRVMSAFSLAWGTVSFGSLLFGGLGSVAGVPVALAAGGMLTVVAVFAVAAAIPTLVRLD